MPTRPRPRDRYTTFLVAQFADKPSETPVYAVRVRAAAEALATVTALTQGAGKPAIVGSLSTRTTKVMKLKPGDVRRV
ncbi:hypothetical protein [Methylobacterium persicinum]|uniref:Uncharacterized protein n=1 Tax=Methylobacterium persicinum TaxID=374426 RepID=A0ABU0HI17_9HYPH|nr:hypothetical protein [Methylobacterium persicinum]MDQ0441355.1 hypothetical protein [Methylobacterium persicinum]GJE36400.1 hypothetical protein KHHGKMAE_0450 [Methylobacterium persicinum]